MTQGLLLLAHGARDPLWARPFEDIARRIRAERPAIAVELAFLEFMAPNLHDCAAALVAGGATKIVVMPMFIAQGGHLKREVPEMLGRLRSTWPAVRFSLGDAIGENEIVVQAMANAALEAAGKILTKPPTDSAD